MEISYILKNDFDFLPAVTLGYESLCPIEFNRIIHHYNISRDGIEDEFNEIFRDEPDEYYNDIIIQVECKYYNFPEQYDLDLDDLPLIPLCIPLPKFDYPITLSDYNSIPRICECSRCGSNFHYPHNINYFESHIILDDRECKECGKTRLNRFFSVEHMNADRAYCLGISYADMELITIDGRDEVLTRIYGTREVLSELISMMGITKTIMAYNKSKLYDDTDCYITFNNSQYHHDLYEIGFVNDPKDMSYEYSHSSLDVPNIPREYYSSFVSGYIRNSIKFMRGDQIYIGIDSKAISRMVMDQMRLDGLQCWEEYCNRMMCVVYKKKS